jgi:hypothetical protein
MDDDQDLKAPAGAPVATDSESLDFESLKSLLLDLNPQFKCEICLQDQFSLQSAGVSAPCLPFYDLENPSFALAVRFCVALTCLSCGNTKLLDRKFLQARLAHEG